MITTSPVWVGIDIGSTELVLHHLPAGEWITEANTTSGVKKLCKQLSKLSPKLIVAEATGGYQRRLLEACRDTCLPLIIVNPRQTNHFAKAIGRLEKTDAVDAVTLAQYAETVHPELRPLPDAATQALHDLVTRRRQMVDIQVAEQQRLHQATPAIRPSIVTFLKFIAKNIIKIDKQLADSIKNSPHWSVKSQILRSAKGAGPVLVATLIALVPELGTLTRREIAKLIGVAPLAKDSGKYRGRRHCFGGRSCVRSVLYMCMGSTIRYNPIINALYTRLKEKGKPEKVARIACVRKFLVRLNAMMRDQLVWQDILIDETIN